MIFIETNGYRPTATDFQNPTSYKYLIILYSGPPRVGVTLAQGLNNDLAS